MALNKHFRYNVKSEQNLVENLIIESLQFYGQDVYYLPREIVNLDKVFLDDVPSRFGQAYKIEMYIENTAGFEGDGELFSKFGIEIRDTATFVVSIKRWKEMIGRRLSENNYRPREGDLIYLPLSKSIFQIMRANQYDPFFQVGQLPTFKLNCELFEYNDEDFDTNIANIDNIEADGAFQYSLTLDSGSGFIIGETITQAFSTYSMKGEITRWSDSDKVMHVAHAGSTDGTFKEFGTTKLVVGGTSNKSATPTLVQELQKIQNDAQNKIFDDFESDFLDFSESNPFGDMS